MRCCFSSHAGDSGIAVAALSAMTLLIAVLGRHALESSMFSHMLLQMPMLILSGVLLSYAGVLRAQRWRERIRRLCAGWDAYGLPSMLSLLLCSAYWMIPNAVERAVVSPLDDLAKCISLVVAGMLLPYVLRKSHLVVQIFFIGNFAWMMAIAGITYQDAPQRLCNSYLLNDQINAGIGLVVLAIILPLWWGGAQLHAFSKKNGHQQAGVFDGNGGVR